MLTLITQSVSDPVSEEGMCSMVTVRTFVNEIHTHMHT